MRGVDNHNLKGKDNFISCLSVNSEGVDNHNLKGKDNIMTSTKKVSKDVDNHNLKRKDNRDQEKLCERTGVADYNGILIQGKSSDRI